MVIRKSRTLKNGREYAVLISMLRDLRLQAGLRQVDLADRLNLPQSFISKYESGERRLDFFEIRDICQAMNTSLGEVIKRLEEKLSILES